MCYIFKHLAEQKNNYLMYKIAISKLFIIELKRLELRHNAEEKLSLLSFYTACVYYVM